MADSGARRKWTHSQTGSKALKAVASLKPTQPRVQHGYDQYLSMLQERNRLLKKLRQKDNHQVELEKREQGFALYLNGANISSRKQNSRVHQTTQRVDPEDVSQPISSSTSEPIKRTRSTRTADPALAGGEENTALNDEEVRAKSAPSRRKSWSHKAVELRASEGASIHVEVPGTLSGKYEDDFESSLTQEQKSSRKGREKEDASDNEVELSSGSETSVGAGDGGGIEVGFADISVLRESLEHDSIIRKSILDSLQGDSSEESCSEDLDTEQQDITQSSPPLLSYAGPPAGIGIVLEFGKPSQHLPKLHAESNPNIELGPVRTVALQPPKAGDIIGSNHISEDSDEITTNVGGAGHTSELQRSAKPTATRSLSATVLKKSHSSIEDLSSTQEVQDVLEAVHAENAMVGGASQIVAKDGNRNSKQALLKDCNIDSHQKIDSKDEVKVEAGEEGGPVSSSETHEQNSDTALQTSSKPGFPLKPVLLSYNVSKPSKFHVKQSRAALKPALGHTSPVLGHSEASGHTSPTLGHGEEAEDIASHSLTEHTLKIITEKVRNMNSKQQHKLLDLLGKLDRQLLSSAAASRAPTPATVNYTVSGSSQKAATIPNREDTNHCAPQDMKTEVGNSGNSVVSQELASNSRQSNEDIYKLLDLKAGHQTTDLTESTGHSVELQRQSSGRTTGLRAELMTSEGSTSVTDLPGLRGSSATRRQGSGRTSGLRGEMRSDGSRSSYDPSRLGSGRLTGLRGELAQQECSAEMDQEDTNLMHPNDDSLTSPLSDAQPRLRTAVLARGNRPLLLGCSGSDTCLLPEITSNPSNRPDSSQQSELLHSTRLTRSEECLTPLQSHYDPEQAYAHFQPSPLATPTQLSMDQCLASISKFDHSHLGQISSMQDDILETFLSEYRQKRQPHSETTPTPSPTTSAQPNQNTRSWSRDKREPSASYRVPPEGGGEGEEGEWFSIPELPIGRELVLNILSTWGDRYYVGLTGIEVYTASGQLAKITHISADPRDINVLPEYDSDPRVVGNLLDGTNQTRDDMHMWLTPFTSGQHHLIAMQFPIPYALAVVRIWNYNKSRIYSSRGARHVDMFLDGRMIFSGEVARASGTTASGTAANSETILFTVDDGILERVSRHDPVFLTEQQGGSEHDYTPSHDYELHRPKTASLEPGMDPDCRPFTSAAIPGPILEPGQDDVAKINNGTQKDRFTGSIVQIKLIENWGDSSSIGLTSIALLEAGSRQPIAIRPGQLTLSLPGRWVGAGGERCDVGRLIDGVNVTTDAAHMWVCPIPHPSDDHASQYLSLTLTLDTPTSLAGVRVWNYNVSMEDSYKGVKLLYVTIDGHPLLLDGWGREGAGEEVRERGFLLRRAPGNVQYNFAQDVLFDKEREGHVDPPPSYLPRGFVFQFQLLSTWGDAYYVGLTGLELYDQDGRQIPLTADNIAAFPDSVNVLPDVTGDLRTPDKLVDGVYDTQDGSHMWLAPVLPGITNSVYVVFDEPRAISKVLLWNYGKTHSRGVKEMALLVDDLLVFTGTIPATPTHARGILPSLHIPLDPFIISFPDSAATTDPATIGAVETREGDVQFTNDRQVMSEVVNRSYKAPPNQDLRPLTSLTSAARPNGNSKWWN